MNTTETQNALIKFDGEEIERCHSDITELSVKFLRQCLYILTDTTDLCAYFINAGYDFSGITGGADLDIARKCIDEDNNHTENFRDLLEKKLGDLSFEAACVTQLLDVFKKEANPYKSRLAELERVLKELQKLDGLDVHSDEYADAVKTLVPKLKNLDIPICYKSEEHERDTKKQPAEDRGDGADAEETREEKNGAEELEYKVSDADQAKQGRFDTVLMLESINKDIDELRLKQEKFESTFGNNDKVNHRIQKLKDDLQREISGQRNVKAHDQEDKKQQKYDARERAKYLKEHIQRWSIYFAFRDKIQKLDEYLNKAIKIYERFNEDKPTLTVIIGGKECRDLSELVSAMVENWDLGVEMLKANDSVRKMITAEKEELGPTYKILTNVVEAVQQKETERKIAEITEAKQRREQIRQFDTSVYADYKLWYDACLFKFVYSILPDYGKFCWRELNLAPYEFARKYLIPLLRTNQYESTKYMIKRFNIDTFAEYGLFSFYFEKKYENDQKQRAKIKKIRDIETDILKMFKTDSSGGNLINLYEIYVDIITLAEEFGCKTVYYFENRAKLIITTRENAVKYMADLLAKGDIGGASYLVYRNTFPFCRAWLLYNWPERAEEINRFFSWYLLSLFLRRYSYVPNTAERTYRDLSEMYHKTDIPVTDAELDCMACIRFLKLLADNTDAAAYEQTVREGTLNVIKIFGRKLAEGSFAPEIEAPKTDYDGEDTLEKAVLGSFVPETDFESAYLSCRGKGPGAKADTWHYLKDISEKDLIKSGNDRMLDASKFRTMLDNAYYISTTEVPASDFLLNKYYEAIAREKTGVSKGLLLRANEFYIMTSKNIWGTRPKNLDQTVKSTGKVSELKELKGKLEDELDNCVDFIAVCDKYFERFETFDVTGDKPEGEKTSKAENKNIRSGYYTPARRYKEKLEDLIEAARKKIMSIRIRRGVIAGVLAIAAVVAVIILTR